MSERATAFAVHLLTASGAVLALGAMVAAAHGDFAAMFAWLGAALFVDGIDGPLARKFSVGDVLPRWSGEILDLVIDYATYVFVPAFAIAFSGLAPGLPGIICAGIIVLTGALYFADASMKTEDKSFLGFPGCWNMVALVFFALQPNPWVIVMVTVALAVATFMPWKFIHPVRTRQMRPLNLAVVTVWFLLAALAVRDGLSPDPLVRVGLIVTSIYLMTAGLFIQIREGRT